MKGSLNLLSIDSIETLKANFNVLTFPKDFYLVYESQIPSAGIALLSGEIKLLKGSVVKETISPGHILCLTHLLHQKPLEYGCRVTANSQIILLGRSDVLLSVNDKKSTLYPLLKLIK